MDILARGYPMLSPLLMRPMTMLMVMDQGPRSTPSGLRKSAQFPRRSTLPSLGVPRSQGNSVPQLVVVSSRYHGVLWQNPDCCPGCSQGNMFSWAPLICYCQSCCWCTSCEAASYFEDHAISLFFPSFARQSSQWILTHGYIVLEACLWCLNLFPCLGIEMIGWNGIIVTTGIKWKFVQYNAKQYSWFFFIFKLFIKKKHSVAKCIHWIFWGDIHWKDVFIKFLRNHPL